MDQETFGKVEEFLDRGEIFTIPRENIGIFRKSLEINGVYTYSISWDLMKSEVNSFKVFVNVPSHVIEKIQDTFEDLLLGACK